MKINDFFRSAMKDQDITISELASKTGISKSYLTNLLNGHKRWNEDNITLVMQEMDLEMEIRPRHCKKALTQTA